jgi:ribosomal protein L32E
MGGLGRGAVLGLVTVACMAPAATAAASTRGSARGPVAHTSAAPVALALVVARPIMVRAAVYTAGVTAAYVSARLASRRVQRGAYRRARRPQRGDPSARDRVRVGRSIWRRFHGDMRRMARYLRGRVSRATLRQRAPKAIGACLLGGVQGVFVWAIDGFHDFRIKVAEGCVAAAVGVWLAP